MDLNKLRMDFMAVKAWMVEFEEWTRAEADEIGQTIGAAVKAGDEGELAFWAEWMAGMAEVAAAHRAGLRDLEQQSARWAMTMRRAA